MILPWGTVARGKGSSTRSQAAKKRGRDRLALYFLLIVIAGLLGVIVAILPDSAPDDLLAQPDTAVPTEPAGETRTVDSTGPTADEPSNTESAPLEAIESTADDTVTERYPTGEMVPSAAGSESERVGELWWLPDPPALGEIPGTLYLILDDAGNNIGPLPEFLRFPGPLAVAVLPQLTYSVEAAARTAAAGKEIMLHLPMEAEGGANPGPGALTVDMSDREILRVIDENLGSVPGAVGVNNHMGSRATADRRVMELVLADIHRRSLFFVDSRTTVDTVVKPVAYNLRTPFAERHVFLDNDRSRDAILAAVRGALELAHRQESVVMIGHATVPELASVLNDIYPILIENGYRFGVVSELVSAVEIDEPDVAAPPVTEREG
jgi:uncharacterized protein